MESVRECLEAYGAARRCLVVELDALQSSRKLVDQLCSAAPGVREILAERLAAQERHCAETAAALYYRMESAQDRICRIDEPVLREILERRYLHGESIREIAAATHYSEGHVRRLHRSAMQKLEAVFSAQNERCGPSAAE